MYKCTEPKNGLPSNKNRYFEKNDKAQAYGDVFIFRLCREGFLGLMGAHFTKTWSIPEDRIAREIFGLMAESRVRIGPII